MTFLLDLAEQMERAAVRLEHEGTVQNMAHYLAWAHHLRTERTSILLLAQAYHESPVEVKA